MRICSAMLVALAAVGVARSKAQARQTSATRTVQLPDESAGIDGVVRSLVAAFDQADIVALGEWHEHQIDSDLRIALVRHPDFAKKVHAIVIECASVTEQATLDRYIDGANVPSAQLQRVWKATDATTNGFCDNPMYLAFLAAVREVNSRLPAASRIRVLGGHPGARADNGVENTALSVVRDQALAHHGKALVIFGAAHFYRSWPQRALATMGNDTGLSGKLDRAFHGRTFVVIPVGPLVAPRAMSGATESDFAKFDRAIKSTARPVLLSLQRQPFLDFSADEFLGRTVTSCSPSGCASMFKGSTLTLGKMADACIYIGSGTNVGRKAKL